jgi:hypothetical protein
MVGTPGSSSLPPRGPAIDVSSVDGERSRIFSTASYEAYGPVIDVSSVDGGRSWISSIASQGTWGGLLLMFLALMVDAHGFSSPFPRWSAIDVS